MKRFLQAATGFLLAVSTMVGVAAASSCSGDISNTGTGSTNTVSCTDTQTTNVSCNNTVDLTNLNGQSAGSGSSSVSGNTSGGNATSGSSSNSNSTNVNVSTGCQTATTTSSTPSSSQTPPASNPKVLGSSTSQVTQMPVDGEGVHAGAGGSASTTDAAVAGLSASTLALLVGAGLALRKRMGEEF